MGNRIAKHILKDETWERSTYYLLDAQGNQVSIYEHNPDAPTVEFNLVENNIYGSSRVGSLHREIDLLTSTYSNHYSSILGNKNYEFSNHLGNVLTVFTDKKIPQDEDNNGKVDGYEIGIFSTADYSPFGLELDGRSMRSEGYRYGYQGSEKDDEVKGEGNSYTTFYRQLDPRVGRWFSIDPKMSAWESPYVSMGNNPIFQCDPLGDTVKYDRLVDRINVTISKTFNKAFREKFNSLNASPDVFTYKKTKNNGELGLTQALPGEDIEDLENDNGDCYSQSFIEYNNGMSSSEIDNPIFRMSANFMRFTGQLAGGIITLPVAIPLGLFSGLYNAFAKKSNEIGWGYYIRAEGVGGVNWFNIGLGDYKRYNMLFMRRGGMYKKSQMHPDDCMGGFRYGLGSNRPTQMFEIGDSFGLPNWKERYNLLGVLNVRKKRWRPSQPIYMFHSKNGGNLPR